MYTEDKATNWISIELLEQVRGRDRDFVITKRMLGRLLEEAAGYAQKGFASFDPEQGFALIEWVGFTNPYCYTETPEEFLEFCRDALTELRNIEYIEMLLE